ncbi:MAG: type II secretion system protein N [Hyphomonadaceae bacterium]|nr:type II secretion system protein N [Hyphomonadaceae bacterium]
MKLVIFIVLAVVVVLAGAVAMLPLSMAAEFAAKQAPNFKYTAASGSVWDGKLTSVSYGQQKIGDLTMKADFGALFSGKVGGRVGLAREGFAGETDISYPIGGQAFELSNLKISGKAGMITGMPQAVAATDGQFMLEVKDLKFAGNACERASGEVWTDALAKVTVKGWTGPELRGPVTCKDGQVQLEATGKAPTGEDVVATMYISPRLDMDMTATVLNAQGSAIEALTGIGFKPEGSALVLRQALGSR